MLFPQQQREIKLHPETGFVKEGMICHSSLWVAHLCNTLVLLTLQEKWLTLQEKWLIRSLTEAMERDEARRKFTLHENPWVMLEYTRLLPSYVHLQSGLFHGQEIYTITSSSGRADANLNCSWVVSGLSLQVQQVLSVWGLIVLIALSGVHSLKHSAQWTQTQAGRHRCSVSQTWLHSGETPLCLACNCTSQYWQDHGQWLVLKFASALTWLLLNMRLGRSWLGVLPLRIWCWAGPHGIHRTCNNWWRFKKAQNQYISVRCYAVQWVDDSGSSCGLSLHLFTLSPNCSHHDTEFAIVLLWLNHFMSQAMFFGEWETWPAWSCWLDKHKIGEQLRGAFGNFNYNLLLSIL